MTERSQIQVLETAYCVKTG